MPQEQWSLGTCAFCETENVMTDAFGYCEMCTTEQDDDDSDWDTFDDEYDPDEEIY